MPIATSAARSRYGRTDALPRSRDGLGRDDEARAALEPNGSAAVGERPGAHFRTGQILQDGGVNAELCGDLARGRDDLRVLFRRAVREVQAQDVGAGNKERTQNRRIARGRPDGRDDLRALLQNRFHHALALCAADGRLLRSMKRT